MKKSLIVLDNSLDIQQPAIHVIAEILSQVQVIHSEDALPSPFSFENVIFCAPLAGSELVWSWLTRHAARLEQCDIVALVDIAEEEETWLFDERIWQIKCNDRVISDRFTVNDAYAAMDLAYAIRGSDPLYSGNLTLEEHSEDTEMIKNVE